MASNFKPYVYGVGLEFDAKSFKGVKDEFKGNLDSLEKLVKSYDKILKVDPDIDLTTLFKELRQIKAMTDGMSKSGNAMGGFVDKGVLERIANVERGLDDLVIKSDKAQEALGEIGPMFSEIKSAGAIKMPGTFDKLFSGATDQSKKIKETQETIKDIEKLEETMYSMQVELDRAGKAKMPTSEIKAKLDEFLDAFDLDDAKLSKPVDEIQSLGKEIQTALNGLSDEAALKIDPLGKNAIISQIDGFIESTQEKAAELKGALNTLRLEQEEYNSKQSVRVNSKSSQTMGTNAVIKAKVEPKVEVGEWVGKLNTAIKDISGKLEPVRLTPTFSKTSAKSLNKDIGDNAAKVDHTVDIGIKVTDDLPTFRKAIERIDAEIKSAQASLKENKAIKVEYGIAREKQFQSKLKQFKSTIATMRKDAEKSLTNIPATISLQNKEEVLGDVHSLAEQIKNALKGIEVEVTPYASGEVISRQLSSNKIVPPTKSEEEKKLENIIKSKKKAPNQDSVQETLTSDKAIAKQKELNETIAKRKTILKDLEKNGLKSGYFSKLGKWDSKKQTFDRSEEIQKQLFDKQQKYLKYSNGTNDRKSASKEEQTAWRAINPTLTSQKKHIADAIANDEKELASINTIVAGYEKQEKAVKKVASSSKKTTKNVVNDNKSQKQAVDNTTKAIESQTKKTSKNTKQKQTIPNPYAERINSINHDLRVLKNPAYGYLAVAETDYTKNKNPQKIYNLAKKARKLEKQRVDASLQLDEYKEVTDKDNIKSFEVYDQNIFNNIEQELQGVKNELIREGQKQVEYLTSEKERLAKLSDEYEQRTKDNVKAAKKEPKEQPKIKLDKKSQDILNKYKLATAAKEQLKLKGQNALTTTGIGDVNKRLKDKFINLGSEKEKIQALIDSVKKLKAEEDNLQNTNKLYTKKGDLTKQGKQVTTQLEEEKKLLSDIYNDQLKYANAQEASYKKQIDGSKKLTQALQQQKDAQEQAKKEELTKKIKDTVDDAKSHKATVEKKQYTQDQREWARKIVADLNTKSGKGLASPYISKLGRWDSEKQTFDHDPNGDIRKLQDKYLALRDERRNKGQRKATSEELSLRGKLNGILKQQKKYLEDIVDVGENELKITQQTIATEEKSNKNITPKKDADDNTSKAIENTKAQVAQEKELLDIKQQEAKVDAKQELKQSKSAVKPKKEDTQSSSKTESKDKSKKVEIDNANVDVKAKTVDVTSRIPNHNRKVYDQFAKFVEKRAAELPGYKQTGTKVNVDPKTGEIKDATVSFKSKDNSSGYVERYAWNEIKKNKEVIGRSFEKISSKYTENLDNYLKQITKQDNASVKYSKKIADAEKSLDPNANKTLANTKYADELKSKIASIKDEVAKLDAVDGNGERVLFSTEDLLKQQRIIESMILDVNTFMTQSKNENYAPIDFDSKDVTAQKYRHQSQLDAFIEQAKRAGEYTGDFKSQLDGLQESLNKVKVGGDLRKYQSEFSVARNNLTSRRSYGKLYNDLADSAYRQVKLGDQITSDDVGPNIKPQLEAELALEEEIYQQILQQLEGNTALYDAKRKELEVDQAINKAMREIDKANAAKSDKIFNTANNSMIKDIDAAQKKYDEFYRAIDDAPTAIAEQMYAKVEQYDSLMSKLRDEQIKLQQNPELANNQDYRQQFDSTLSQIKTLQTEINALQKSEADVSAINKQLQNLNNLENALKTTSLYTDDLAQEFAQLKNQISNAHTVGDVELFKFDFDNFKGKIKELESYKKIYDKFVDSMAKEFVIQDKIKTSSSSTQAIQKDLIAQKSTSQELERQLSLFGDIFNAEEKAAAEEAARAKATAETARNLAAQNDKQVDAQNQTFDKMQSKYQEMQRVDSNIPVTGKALEVLERYGALLSELKAKQSDFGENNGFDELVSDMSKAEQEFYNLRKASENLFAKANGVEDIRALGDAFNSDDINNLKASMIDFANSAGIGNAEMIDFNDTQKTAVFTIRTAENELKRLTVAYDKGTQSLVRYSDKTFSMESGSQKIFNNIGRGFAHLTQYVASFGSFYEVIAQIRRGFEYVKEIDSALTELKKVTNETDATYSKFLQTASQTASVVGSTVAEITTMTAEWARLGNTLADSAKLAKSTAVLLNVSEFENATDASQALISTMQAFQYTADESMNVVDVLNEVGNNYAVSSDGIATALQSSASALYAAGNDMNKSVAMIAAANKVTQDPSKVGAALRTISLRLRGTEVKKMEELGEDTDGLVSQSKMREKVKSLSGIDILTNTGAYKDTYTIIKEIGSVWKDMSDMDQAALLELMAGKNRSNVMAALLTNMEDLEGAYTKAQDAAGSAYRENQEYLNSIQGKMDLFTNSVQTFWMNLLESSSVKNLIDQGTNLVKFLDTFIGKLTAAAATWATVSKIKNKVSFKEMFGGLYESFATNVDFLKNPITKGMQGFGNNRLSGQAIFSTLEANGASDTTIDGIKNIDGLTEKTKQLTQAQKENVAGALRGRLANDELTASQYACITSSLGLVDANTAVALGGEEQAVSALKAAVANEDLAASDAAVALSAMGLATSENLAAVGCEVEAESALLAAVANGKLAMSNAYATLTANGMSRAMAAAKVGTSGLLNVLKANPILAVAAAGYAASKSFDLLIHTSKESFEAMQDRLDGISSAVDSTTSELNNMQSEFDEINKQISELDGKNLTFTDDQELQRLKDRREELIQNMDAQRNLLEDQKQTQAGIASTTLTDFLKSSPEATKEAEKTGKILGGVAGAAIAAGIILAIPTGGASLAASIVGALGTTGSIAAVGAAGYAGSTLGGELGTKMNESNGSFEDWYRMYETVYAKKQEAADKAKKKYESAPGDMDLYDDWQEKQNAVNEVQSGMYDQLTQIQQYVNQMNYGISDEIDKQLDSYYNFIDKLNIEKNSPNAKKNALDRLFGENASQEVKDFKKQVDEALDEDKKLDIEIPPEIVAQVEDLGMSVEDLEGYLTRTGEVGVGTFDDLSGAISDAQQASEALNDSLGAESNGGYETRDKAIDEMQKLINKGLVGSESNLWNIAEKYGFTRKAGESIDDMTKRLQHFINVRKDWYKVDEDGDITKAGTDAFASDMQSAVNSKSKTGQALRDAGMKWNFDSDAGILDFSFNNMNLDEIVEQLAKTKELSGITKEEFIDMMTAIGQFGEVNWSSGNDILTWIDALAEGGATATDQLDSMKDPLQSLLSGENIDGNTIKDWLDSDTWFEDIEGNTTFQKLSDDIQEAIKKYKELQEVSSARTEADLYGGSTDAQNAYQSLMNGSSVKVSSMMGSVNLDLSGIEGANNQIKSLEDSIDAIQEVRKLNLDDTQAQQADTILKDLIERKQELEAPTIMNVDTSTIKDDGLRNGISLLKKFQRAQNDLEKKKSLGLDTEDAKNKVNGLKKNIKNLNPEVKAKLGIDPKSTATIQKSIAKLTKGKLKKLDIKVKVDKSEADQYKPDDKKAKVHFTVDDSKVAAYKVPDKKGTITYAPSVKALTDAQKNKTGTIIYKAKVQGGPHDVNGSAHASGTAHARGDWGTKKTETALVGELGQELVVDPTTGTWHTVGDNGAEFTNIKKGSIVFNHKQTEELLKNGYVTSRGKAYADGTAYANGGYGGNNTSNKKGTPTKKKSTPTKKNKKKSKKKSTSKSDFREVLDWIEIKIEEINESLDLMGAKLQNAVSLDTKGTIFDDMLKTTKSEISTLEKGYKKYQSYANSILKARTSYKKYTGKKSTLKGALKDMGVSTSKTNLQSIAEANGIKNYTGTSKQNAALLKKLKSGKLKKYKIPKRYWDEVQNGKIAIETFKGKTDEKTYNQIKKYREWAKKAADMQLEMQRKQTELTELAVQKIDTIGSRYDARMSLRNSRIDNYQAAASLRSEKGIVPGDAYYEATIEREKSIQSLAQEKYDKMSAEFEAQVTKGNIKKYSDAWYEQVAKINSVQKEIIDADLKIEQAQNTIIENYWKRFQHYIDAYDRVSSEAKNLIDILGEEDLVDKDKGVFTDEGIATIGLYAQQMEIAEKRAEKYKAEFAQLNKDYADGKYSLAEYNEKLEELNKGQYDSIQSYHDAKKAIVDLEKARIDEVKNGIDKELDAYSKLIDKKKEELSAEKDLYDFQKSVMEQQKDIAKIQRKLAALANDNSASAVAERKKLEAELVEAQSKLQESYYDRSIQDQQDALDKEVDNLKEAKEKEKEQWDEYLKDTEVVVKNSIDLVRDHTAEVYNTLTDYAADYSLELSDSLVNPWKKAEDAIDSYTKKFNDSISGTTDEIKNIDEKWDNAHTIQDNSASKVVAEQDAEYDKLISANNPTPSTSSSSSSSYKKPSSSSSSSSYKKPSKISGTINSKDPKDNIKAVENALKKLGFFSGKIDGKWDSTLTKALKNFQKQKKIKGKTLTVINGDGKSVGKKTKAKFKALGYAKGTTGVKDSQLAWIDEFGEELVLRPNGKGKLSYLTKGTSVIPEDLTKNLMKWGELDPQAMIDRSRPTIGTSPHIINQSLELNMNIGEVVHIDKVTNDTIPDLTKAVEKQMDTYMAKVNNSLKRYSR